MIRFVWRLVTILTVRTFDGKRALFRCFGYTGSLKYFSKKKGEGLRRRKRKGREGKGEKKEGEEGRKGKKRRRKRKGGEEKKEKGKRGKRKGSI